MKIKNEHAIKTQLTATGGIRDGIQVAKAVALGASMVGVGLPLFRAVVSPSQGMNALESVENELDFFKKSLLISMFCSGVHTLNALTCRIENTNLK
jgi:isopentenyl-diphosphate delta-isomerase